MNIVRAAVVLLGLLSVTLVHATAQRTFVASSGNDANTAFNCSVVNPCRGFAAAIGVTNAKGEIIVLDSAGYGPVTITKAVSIIVPAGVYGGISVLSGDGITVTTSNALDVVTLNGITINNQGSTGSGIVYNGFGGLLVINTTVIGFNALITSNGLWFHPSATSGVRVENSEFRGNGFGVNIDPQGAATQANVMLDHVVATSSSHSGFLLQNTTRATIRNSLAAGNSGSGLATGSIAGVYLNINVDNSEFSHNGDGVTPGGDAGNEVVALFNCVIANNYGTGIRAGTHAAVLLASSTVTLNFEGLVSADGPIYSMGNNWILGNPGGDGAPSVTPGGK